MTVKQDDFRDLFASDLAFATQAQHVFGVLSLALVPNPGLAGKKWLEAFALKVIEKGNGRNTGITITSGLMLVFADTLGT
ncbi:Uncharacterised protein [Enterobacter cloacae]|uniref:Uncharacterized protein n=1 Tax=Enterobacter cloacae TaxID=550 RepID=A0A377LWN8_ENTCL|nr:Uncharacterised protein [Enterobacter cloacae]